MKRCVGVETVGYTQRVGPSQRLIREREIGLARASASKAFWLIGPKDVAIAHRCDFKI